MKEAPVISSRPPEQPGMDYALLRREAIDYIEKRGSDYWTDYNNHDPGITILEALCYAITDLSYRLNFDIEDILAEPPDINNGDCRQFFTAREILTVNPVTIEDYRKLIIDIDGVRNAWLKTAEGTAGTIGYYNVYMEPEDGTANDNTTLVEKAKARLLAHRNLCEDFLTITVLPLENIKVSADIFIENDADASAILGEIYTKLADHISPEIPFFTIDEMLARGYSAAEIFEGPPLEHGFIDIKSLEKAKWKAQLHASDLIHIIEDISGVRSVGNLKMCGAPGEWHSWALDITPGHAPRWEKGGDIKLFKGNRPCYIDEQELELNLRSKEPRVKKRKVSKLDLVPPSGTYRSLYDYETIQNEFPLNYGVGHFGLPEDTSKLRKAQANQLRAYLMLFDQILANYLTQLEYIKDLLSPFSKPNASYFATLLPEDTEAKTHQKPGFHAKSETFIVKLLKLDDEALNDVLEPLATARERRENLIEELQEMIEEPRVAMRRRNRILNHLLARFAEEYADVSLLNGKDEMPIKYLNSKQEFLERYPLVSTGRGRAYNYSKGSPVWDSENVSGLEQRIALKLGITNFRRKSLSDKEQEGFHFIEHILLLPTSGERDKTLSSAESDDNVGHQDSFSFQVSFVFPDWVGRFKDEAFQSFVEETIRAEIPAHIRANVHWRNMEYMKEFEKWYEIWQQQKVGGAPESSEAAARLIKLLDIGGEAKTS